MNVPYEKIIECIVGSTLHGTVVNDGLEDLDIMAVVVENQPTFMGFSTTDTWTWRTKPQGVRSEAGDTDFTAYGLRKYLSLALKGNPTVLLALFAPPEHTTTITSFGRELRSLKPKIISQKIFAPFRGYMQQQQKERLLGTRGQKNVTRPELVEAYGFDTKYAAHIMRLGWQGIELLETGNLTLPMKQAERETCIGIRTGKYTLKEIAEWISVLEETLVNSYKTTSLPVEPDYTRVQAWMLEVYNTYWKIP